MTPDATTSLEEIEAHYASAIERAADEAALEEVRVEALGKKGVVSLKMRELGSMDPETRKSAGAALNDLRDRLQGAIETRKAVLAEGALAARLEAERIDVTLDPPREPAGSIHPVSQVMDECLAIFAEMGFSIAEGPDIEDDFYNFTALNFPPDHPARQMHDTFFFEPGADGTRKLLRTHTSPVQIRHMQAHRPPIRIMSPGRTYRSDSDQTHTPMFHQIEGLVIDEEAHMGHLKWVLETFVKAFFETDDVAMRFRPHFFPFTEPSAEMDIARGGGRWLEILGCGMVHPNVLRNVGYDPEIYQGFAFGMGIDRLAMLKYGITDLRPFFEADVRWLAHYGFRPLDLPMLLAGLSR